MNPWLGFDEDRIALDSWLNAPDVDFIRWSVRQEPDLRCQMGEAARKRTESLVLVSLSREPRSNLRALMPLFA